MDQLNEAICHYCGEKLPHEKCGEARKKPEPGKFAEALRRIAWDEKRECCNTQAIKLEDRNLFLQAASEIDRLKVELATLKDELTCEECEQSLVDPETGVTALCMTCWNAMITKLRAEIDRLTADLKTKDDRIEELLGEVDACRAVIEEQALEKGLATEGTEVTEK